eukprot:jgi/Ulvmu1/999/UM103_0027.1
MTLRFESGRAVTSHSFPVLKAHAGPGRLRACTPRVASGRHIFMPHAVMINQSRSNNLTLHSSLTTGSSALIYAARAALLVHRLRSTYHTALQQLCTCDQYQRLSSLPDEAPLCRHDIVMISCCSCCVRMAKCKLISAVAFVCAGAFLSSLVSTTFAGSIKHSLAAEKFEGCLSCATQTGGRMVDVFLRSPAVHTASPQLLAELRHMNVDFMTSIEDEELVNCRNCDSKAAVAALLTAAIRAVVVAVSSVACFLLALVPACLLCCGHAKPPPPAPPLVVPPHFRPALTCT